eukprot:Rmarinus@m.16039
MAQESATLLHARQLSEVLKQAATHGVKSSMLLNFDGSLLAAAGDISNAKLISGIVGNLWHEYELARRTSLESENMNLMFVQCQGGAAGLTRVQRFLVCLYCDPTVGFGLMKSKLEALREFFDEPLSILCDSATG